MSVFLNLLIIGALTGAAAIILGGVLGFKVLPDLVDERLQEEYRLELSEQYQNWQKLQNDVVIKFYFFNVRNEQAIMTGSDPILAQVGPIIYRQQRMKENIRYDKENDVFAYDQRVVNEFQPESRVEESTEITTLNIVKLLTLSILEGNPIPIHDLATYELLFSDTEKDSLFHKVPLANIVKVGTKFFEKKKIDSNLEAQLVEKLVINALKDQIQIQKSSDGSFYEFSLFKHKLNFIENSYQMHGGYRNISKQGKFYRINNQQYLHNWPKKNRVNFCNQFRGTDPYTFPTNIDVDSEITIFNSDLCRSMDYAFTEEVEMNDVIGQRLILKSENYAPSDLVPENNCFCIEDDKDVVINTKCLPQGFLNLKSCIGLPIIASQPHFLYTESKYANQVKFTPSIEQDVSFIDIHADSGILLRATRRTQYNIKLRSFKDFNPKTKEIIFPLFWVEESFETTPKTLQSLQKVYLDEMAVIEGVKWGLLGVGVVLVLSCVLIFGYNKLNLNKKS